MGLKMPQGAALKDLYLDELRRVAISAGTHAGNYDAQGRADDAKKQAGRMHGLQELVASMERLSDDHQLLNNPMLVPFVPVRNGDDQVVWIVRDERFMQTAAARHWNSAEEWLTATLRHLDFIA
jgi:hypothetical protein